MTKRLLLAAIIALASAMPAMAQDAGPSTGPNLAVQGNPDHADFDTSYRPSPTVAARLQRAFLDRIRWSAGIEVRDNLAGAFAEKSPVDIWLELVAADGLEANNVADALAAYWVLNWVAANGAYEQEIDNGPVQRQLRAAFANDANFLKMGDQQRQELAEGYILDFLVEHATLNAAVADGNTELLTRIGTAAALQFRQKFGVDLLSVKPGPDGFVASSQ